MLTYVMGNLFESPARVLVNTVNTDGVMGKGIAKTFKEVYPEMFKRYQILCEEKKFSVGKVWLYKSNHKWILNFPTKTTWKKPSKIEYIESGLEAFTKGYAERGITSIAFPMLGCGNGGLNWENQVKPVMEKYLQKLPIKVFIYIYPKNYSEFTPEHFDTTKTKRWLQSEPKSLSLNEIIDDLKELQKKPLLTIIKKEEFTFTVSRGNILLRIRNSDALIKTEKVAEFWNSLRSFGFISSQHIPSGLEAFSEHLISIFSNLPYIQTVRLGSNYSDLLQKSENLGIQILPTISKNWETNSSFELDIHQP